MFIFLKTLHFLSCFTLIGIVLIQAGKGSQLGATFAAGASQTLFGTVGQKDIMLRITAVICAVFFITSILLARMPLTVGVSTPVTEEIVRQESQAPKPQTP